MVCLHHRTYLTKDKSIKELTRWIPWACALAIGANVAGIALVSHVPLILFHPLSTFGAGVAYGYVLKVFHASGKQERSYGTFLAALYLSELVIFQLINYLTANTLQARFSMFTQYSRSSHSLCRWRLGQS